MQEPEIAITSREDLIYLLTEAAEIEHNLMCCYLFAAFGMKTAADGLDPATAAEIAGWKRAITGVAVEEMTHLALVNNLLLAVGGAPHFGRPNFPVAPGYHPSGLVATLRRFDRATLDHFVYLERPEGVDLDDSSPYAARTDASYHREVASRRFMPSAQDYLTVGHFYRAIRVGLETLSKTLGEKTLFRGDPALQVTHDLVSLEGMRGVTDLASALAAIDTIVEQGEGSPADVEHSHYRRFVTIREAFAARLARDPAFEPSRPVAENPVMRKPPQPDGKTYIDHPQAAQTLDFANAIYNAMLRGLAQGFSDPDPVRKKRLINAAIDTMFALNPVAEYLTTLPACVAHPDLRAGISFAMMRDAAALPAGDAAIALLVERYETLAHGAAVALQPGPLADTVATSLQSIADALARRAAAGSSPAIEVAEGKDLVIGFETRRCIHARFCVLGEPGVFKANVVGPWIAPDDATTTENLVAVAKACPSGAITYRRKDGGAEESAPPVNLVQVRENGPLGIRAEMTLDGEPAGFRATLCRCGASNNKPFCDGSHKDAGFSATGEPATGDVTPLAVRSGVVDIRPQTNGPLLVSGPMEMISGTGRTFRKATSAALCRCGASANKPFCDGSHARVGFKS
jgi:CDGSH-type Zn-finger protein/uncharacterized Fe-S cluster protein YjdI